MAVVLVSFGVYFSLADSKPKKRKPKARRSAMKKVPEWKKSEGGGVEIPSEIPRNVSTIQTMADEDPDVVAEVVKMWLHGKG